MNEKRYIISDASKILDVESHVLRYWEEELEIKIPRNEMGHRYYTENHINLLKSVRDLKKQGYGLKTIRIMLGGEPKELPADQMQNTKIEQFKEIMGEIVSKALRENAGEIGKNIRSGINIEIKNELSSQLEAKEAREEERFKRLDEAIRAKQRGKSEESVNRCKKKTKKKIFGRKKVGLNPV
ncbi:MAG: MerR family transcriptional regulator [Lachnospiraceae bacterium]|nr:MerR family transcriptional regulator [Lachnospiraceae bacterium]